MLISNTIADFRQQIHDDLRRQHPEWVLPNGECPMCDAYEARLMEEIDSFMRTGIQRACRCCSPLEHALLGDAIDALHAGDHDKYIELIRSASKCLDDVRKLGCDWISVGRSRAADSVANALDARFLSAALAIKVRRVKEMAPLVDLLSFLTRMPQICWS